MIKILLIEDDSLISRLYQKAFSFDLYEVEVASDGEEGFDKIKLFKPDLILMDFMMPKMNGLELLEKVKKEEGIKKIPVIMLTNIKNDKNIDTAIKLGAVKYIVKGDQPPSEVVAMVEETLSSLQLEH